MTSHLLIADIESFFGIVVFLIAIMGWIVNLVSQNQEQNKRPPQRRSPQTRQSGSRESSVQNEIDQFLSQSRRTGGRVSKPAETEEVEVISTPPSRRPPPPRRRKSREEVWAEQTGQSKPQAPKPARKPVSSQRTLQAEKPKKSRPISNLAQQVEQDLPHKIDEHVESHLAQFTASSPSAVGQTGIAATTRSRKSQANTFATLLKSKSGVRNAILLNEILSPPKAMRNKPR